MNIPIVLPIYTDGSKASDRVGCAAINISIKQRLPSNT